MFHRIVVAAVMLGLSLAISQGADAQALPELQPRLGGRAFYDPIRNITWLTDANYARNSGYHVTGLMDWDDANVWAASLAVGGITGWRLPTTPQPDATCSYQSAGYSGGGNCTGSDLGDMFYRVLGGVAGESLNTTHNDNYHLFPSLQYYQHYWSDTVYAWSGTEYRTYRWSSTLWSGPMVGSRNTAEAWEVYLATGGQGRPRISAEAGFAWVVHDGDVDLIPDTTAPVVTPTLPGRIYLSAQRVGFTTDEPATVYYTTDGAAPTASSPVYVDPILIAGDTTIRYFGADPAGNRSAPESVTYTITVGASVWAWGSNASGQLGDGTVIPDLPSGMAPVQVSSLTGVTAVAGGANWSVAVKSDGTVWAWGNNASGQLGGGTMASSAVPVQVIGFGTVGNVKATAVAAGAGHTVALDENGDVWTWGWNGNGQLGDGGTSTQRSIPYRVTGVSHVIAVAAGAFHTVALDASGMVWAWGINSQGQLGDGTTTARWSPVPAIGFWVIAVAAGDVHTVTLRSNGTVWAWGGNTSGQLGDGTTTSSSAPVQALADAAHPLHNVVSVAAGWQHTVVLKSDGTVWAWGDNDVDQLGSVTPPIYPGGVAIYRSLFPLQVSGVADVAAVAAGRMHTVALKSDGTVWAWGAWAANGLGVVSARSLVPVQMSGLANVAVVAAGSDHSFAIIATPPQTLSSPRLSYSTEAGYGTDGVNPDTGTVLTQFTFKIVYTHTTNQAPAPVSVCIDSVCSAMSQDTSATDPLLRDGDFTNGEQYSFTTYSYFFAAGLHTYHFEASDGTRAVALPATGDNEGPTISDLAITAPGPLPFGVQGTPYIGAPLTASGGTRPYRWTASGLPAGFTIDQATGVISGPSTAAGYYTITVSVTDWNGHVYELQLAITINLYSTPPPVQTFNLRDLGTLPGASFPYPVAMNSSGQVVGHMSNGSRAWIYNNGPMSYIPTLPGGTQAVATAINASGQVIGQSTTATGNYYHGYVYDSNSGAITKLTLPGGGWSYALAINDSGQVVGRSGTANYYESRAFLYESRTGAITPLGSLGGSSSAATAINNSGQVAGSVCFSSLDCRTFLYDSRTGAVTYLGTLPGGNSSAATAINDAGQVAGSAKTASGDYHAFRWDSVNGMRDLGAFAGITTYAASAINSSGKVIGRSYTDTATYYNHRAFLFDDAAGGIMDLGTLGGPWTSYGGSPAINNSGQIVGHSRTADGLERAFVYDNGVMKQMASSSPDWQRLIAGMAISDNGQIAGYGLVNGEIHVFVTVPSTVTVTQQPASRTVSAGDTVTFTATAIGSPDPTVQWQVSTDRGTTWTDVTGATSTAYSFATVAADHGKRVRAVFTNVTGSVASNSATVGIYGNASGIPASLRFAAAKTPGSSALIAVTGAQAVTVAFAGAPGAWTASTTQSWLQVTSGSGTGAGQFTVSIVNPGNAIGGSTLLSGTITITSLTAPNSPVSVPVTLTVDQTGGLTRQPPIGLVDAPVQNATGQVGAIGVTGWVVDDVGVQSVKIYRNCLSFEPAVNCAVVNGVNLVYIGDATIVAGARPDIESVYATYPQNNRAAWGYLLSTNTLPHIPNRQMFGGQGTLTLHVLAEDMEGHLRWLGRSFVNFPTETDQVPTTLTMANDTIAKPFGAIDTPTPGETVGGSFWNFGWTLTPDGNMTAEAGDILMPLTGATQWVYIDGAPVAPIGAYNLCRGTVGSPVPAGVYCNDDVSSIFGNLAPQPTFTTRTANATKHRNLDAGRGPIGAYWLDTTTLSNGLHTIVWGVTDSAGRGEGIGTRYFTVLNSGAGDSAFAADRSVGGTPALLPDVPAAAAALREAPALARGDARALEALAPATGRVWGRTGYGVSAPLVEMTADDAGVRHVQIRDLGRLEVWLGAVEHGYLVANGTLRDLPPGSSLDPRTGQFTWAPGVGYFGTYRLAFVRGGEQLLVDVTIRPMPSADADGREILMTVDTPRTGEAISGAITIAGWALDPQAWTGSGIDAVHVWAQRADLAAAAPQFLGAAALSGVRPDVADVYGPTFGTAGFSLTSDELAPGQYDVTIFVWSRRTARWEDARAVRVIVR